MDVMRPNDETGRRNGRRKQMQKRARPDICCHLNDATDAKVGQIQHSPRRKSHSSPRYVKNGSTETGNREKKTTLLQWNDRPEGNCTSRQAKTCIWVEYRQHQISALIDTGSDVSLAGDKLAQELEWIIHAHSTEAVTIANNGTMTIRGAVRVVLVVAGRGVMSEILIASDFDGLLLGINWLRSQGRVSWDFDRGEIKFGKQDWIKLRRETEQPPRTSINQKDFPMAMCEIGADR